MPRPLGSDTTGDSGGVPTPDENVDAYVPLNVLKERLGDIVVENTAGGRSREQVELHQMIVEVEDKRDVAGVAAALNRMFETFHDKRDWRMTVPLELLRQAEQTARTFNIVLGSIAGISLLVGGIGIMNIMLASVTERTREIGIRRAIGARRGQIIQQFLIETIVLSTSGGVIGVALGVLIPEIIERYAEMPTIVRGWMVILSVGHLRRHRRRLRPLPGSPGGKPRPDQGAAARVRSDRAEGGGRRAKGEGRRAEGGGRRVRSDQRRCFMLRRIVVKIAESSLASCLSAESFAFDKIPVRTSRSNQYMVSSSS